MLGSVGIRFSRMFSFRRDDSELLENIMSGMSGNCNSREEIQYDNREVGYLDFSNLEGFCWGFIRKFGLSTRKLVKCEFFECGIRMIGLISCEVCFCWDGNCVRRVSYSGTCEKIKSSVEEWVETECEGYSFFGYEEGFLIYKI